MREMPTATWLSVALSLVVVPLSAQEPGSVSGIVTAGDTGAPVHSASVDVAGLSLAATTSDNGRFTFRGLVPGRYTLSVAALGYTPREVEVSVAAGSATDVTISLEVAPYTLAELVVNAASRAPQRVVEAPAAISVVSPQVSNALSVTAQVPAALAAVPGVEVVQNGMFDYNVNTRGFNSSLTRRMLVLIDGRDQAIALLGVQEWSSLSSPMSDFRSIEVVRGPGSALYGANAYSGVIDITSWGPRDIQGLRATVAGGELGSLSGDLRYSVVSADGRVGFKANGGYTRSDSWAVSRTAFDGGSLRREYDDPSLPDEQEGAPLLGQTVDPVTGTPLGDPDPVTRKYGSARLDYYRASGGVVTAEAGATLSENPLFVTGLGRIQIDESWRPWSRVEWAESGWNASAWYSGRSTRDAPQRSLAAGAPIIDRSSIYQAEVQATPDVGEGFDLIVGGSIRNTRTDTEETMFIAAFDDRSDWSYSGYAQASVDLSDRVQLVGALRADDGDLFDLQVSPRVALVFSPSPLHSLRLTAGRAFQTPTQLERFVSAPAALPADLSLLEAGLRLSPLGPALANVPQGELFTTTAAVPILIRGNEQLDVESVRSVEAGYKGQVADGLFLTADVYYGELTNFVTDVLPGVNPGYGAWTAPAAVPEAFRGALEDAVMAGLVGAGPEGAVLAAGLTRLQDQSTAVVLSYGNAGEAKQYGGEVALTATPTPTTSVTAAYAYFGAEIEAGSLVQGDQLIPNAPTHRASLSVDYFGAQGFDVGGTLRVRDAFSWAAGIYAGRVPASQLVDVRGGYRVSSDLRFHVVATNLFDQQRPQIWGGSVIGRRILAGLTYYR